jgi:hypothetical protein
MSLFFVALEQHSPDRQSVLVVLYHFFGIASIFPRWPLELSITYAMPERWMAVALYLVEMYQALLGS